MSFQPCPDIAKAAIRFRLFGQDVVNTLHFRSNVPMNPTIVGNIAAYVDGWVSSSLLPALTGAVTYRETTVTDLSEEGGTQVINGDAGGQNGGLFYTGNLPNQTALVVSFRTLRSGRSYRGRNYLAGWSGTQLEGPNTFLGGVIFGVSSAYNAMLADLNSLGSSAEYNWVVLSRFLNKEPRSAGLGTPVDRIQITSVDIKSQRRRMPGNGS